MNKTLKVRVVSLRVAGMAMPMAMPNPNGAQPASDGYLVELAPVTDSESGWLGTGSSLNLTVQDVTQYTLGTIYELNLTPSSVATAPTPAAQPAPGPAPAPAA